jgi:putative ABC transport system ATP-binding protein
MKTFQPENNNHYVDTAVEFADIHKSFLHQGNLTNILKGISGKVAKGKILTIIGPSGSGKSTLLSLCNLLITPEKGQLLILGKDIREWDIQQLRKQVGIAFQAAPILQGSVLDNLLLPARLHGTQLQAPEKYLEFVGLSSDLLSREAKELSGGQRQRLSLARTLINKPSVLLLDEITSALDPVSVHEVEDLILRINQEQRTTVLWVTHDLSQAKRAGDQTWLIADGTLIEAAPTEQFFSEPKNSLTKQFLDGEGNSKR